MRESIIEFLFKGVILLISITFVTSVLLLIRGEIIHLLLMDNQHGPGSNFLRGLLMRALSSLALVYLLYFTVKNSLSIWIWLSMFIKLVLFPLFIWLPIKNDYNVDILAFSDDSFLDYGVIVFSYFYDFFFTLVNVIVSYGIFHANLRLLMRRFKPKAL